MSILAEHESLYRATIMLPERGVTRSLLCVRGADGRSGVDF